MLVQKLKAYYYFFFSFIFYAPFVRGGSSKFAVISPILFTPRFCSFGKNVVIGAHGRIEGIAKYGQRAYSPLIEIGDNVSIEQNLHLTCANRIVIGESTAIASNVSITDINHMYKDVELPPEKQPIETKEVIIGKNCKIYNNAVILPGAQLGIHTVVGANAVVLGRKYPDYSVLVGNPGRVIKRFSFDEKKWRATDENGNFL